jgi:hypothetical protein
MGAGTAASARFVPQLLQNFTVSAFFAPHFGHSLKSIEAPQLLQNFPEPAGFPHTGQIVVLLSISPCHTVAVSDFSSMLRFIACAWAWAT